MPYSRIHRNRPGYCLYWRRPRSSPRRYIDATGQLAMVYVACCSHFKESYPNLLLYTGFYLNLPTGALSIVTLTLNHIPDTRLRGHNQKLRIAEQIHRLDFPGLFLFAGSVVMLLLGVDWGGVDFAWSSPTIINLFWGAGCVGILFIWWENRQGDNAMMPTELFTYREITFAAAASFMSYGGLYAIIIYLPLWFQAVKGVSPLQSGVYYLPSVITTTIGTIMSGFLGDYFFLFFFIP